MCAWPQYLSRGAFFRGLTSCLAPFSPACRRGEGNNADLQCWPCVYNSYVLLAPHCCIPFSPKCSRLPSENPFVRSNHKRGGERALEKREREAERRREENAAQMVGFGALALESTPQQRTNLGAPTAEQPLQPGATPVLGLLGLRWASCSDAQRASIAQPAEPTIPASHHNNGKDVENPHCADRLAPNFSIFQATLKRSNH